MQRLEVNDTWHNNQTTYLIKTINHLLTFICFGTLVIDKTAAFLSKLITDLNPNRTIVIAILFTVLNSNSTHKQTTFFFFSNNYFDISERIRTRDALLCSHWTELNLERAVGFIRGPWPFGGLGGSVYAGYYMCLCLGSLSNVASAALYWEKRASITSLQL